MVAARSRAVHGRTDPEGGVHPWAPFANARALLAGLFGHRQRSASAGTGPLAGLFGHRQRSASAGGRLTNCRCCYRLRVGRRRARPASARRGPRSGGGARSRRRSVRSCRAPAPAAAARDDEGKRGSGLLGEISDDAFPAPSLFGGLDDRVLEQPVGRSHVIADLPADPAGDRPRPGEADAAHRQDAPAGVERIVMDRPLETRAPRTGEWWKRPAR